MEIDLGDSGSYLSSSKDGALFVPLGRRRAGKVTQRDEAFVQRRSATPPRNIWGTLGPWGEDRDQPLQGTLRCSRSGSDYSLADFSGEATLQEIRNVREARAEHLNQADDGAVRERYISLEGVWPARPEQSFTLETLPHARLTVFVRPDEGALVFYQRMEGRTGSGRLKDPRDTDVEYLLPEPTDERNECGERDRLHYRIPLYAETAMELEGEGTDSRLRAVRNREYKLVIKVLVFRRQNSTSHDVIRRAARRLGLSRHNLLRYDPDAACFDEVAADGVDVDARTLLLLHGTFSSTEGTFGALLDKDGDDGGFLSRLLADGSFEQILAFDHDTIFVSPEENVRRFDALLDERRLAKPVRAVGFSRGALVLKQMAISGETAVIEHGVTVAGANHVGYFAALRSLRWLLTALRYMTAAGPALKILSTLAQHSDNALDKLEGLRAMDRGSDINRRILESDPLETTIIPVTGQFDVGLVEGRLRRITRRALNATISLLLSTRRHDWVVARDQQARPEPLTLPPGAEAIAVESRHTRIIGQKLANDRLAEALLWSE